MQATAFRIGPSVTPGFSLNDNTINTIYSSSWLGRATQAIENGVRVNANLYPSESHDGVQTVRHENTNECSARGGIS